LVISFPLNFGINDPPLPPLIRGVGGIEFVAGIFLIDITGNWYGEDHILVWYGITDFLWDVTEYRYRKQKA
jgi:hypothetical protein